MEESDLISPIFERGNRVSAIWTSYGAFGVVLIGWLISMKGSLLLRHKVASLIVIASVCSLLLVRHYTLVEEVLALTQDLTVKLEGAQSDGKSIILVLKAQEDLAKTGLWINHLIPFTFLSLLAGVNGLWAEKTPS